MSQYRNHGRAIAGPIAGLALSLVACASPAEPPQAQARADQRAAVAACGGYTRTDVGAASDALSSLNGYGISPSGAVTGDAADASGSSQAYAWTPAGGLHSIGSLGGVRSQGNAINAAGQVAGQSFVPGDASQHATFYDPATGIHDLGTFGGTGIEASIAYGINASGTVVGRAELPTERTHAFRWDGGALVDLGITPDGFNSVAYAISDSGVIVGQADGFDQTVHAVKFVDGQIQDLGAIGGGTSRALAVNNAGLAVGEVTVGPNWYPVVFPGDGSVTRIDLLPGYLRGIARDISDSGQVVGELWPDPSTGVTAHRAFVWQDGVTYDLNELVGDPSIDLQVANAINATGQIVAEGRTSDGRNITVVLTPSDCGGARGFTAVTTGSSFFETPAEVTPGDLLIAAFEVDADPSSVTAPVGWNLVRDQRAGTGDDIFHAVVYSHVVTTTDPTSWSFDVPDGVWIGGQIAAYHGFTRVAASASAAATGTRISAPSATASAGDILVAIYIDWAGGTWSNPSGLTERTEFEGNSLLDAVLTSTGATGARAATNTASSGLAALTLVLH